MRRTRSKRTRPRRTTGQGISGPNRQSKNETKSHQWSKRDVDNLRKIHELRSPTAQAVDNALDAELAASPGQWIKYPNRYDVHGVDYPETKTPKAKRDMAPHQRMEPVKPEKPKKKPKPSKKNPMTTPVAAKKHLKPLIEKYSKKLGIEGEVKLSTRKNGPPARIRHYADGSTPQIEINYRHFAEAYDKDPELTERYMEYAIAHELSHQQQSEQLGPRGYSQARNKAKIEVELDADRRALKAMGVTDQELAKDLDRLAEKVGGYIDRKYSKYRIPEGRDLNRFKDHSPIKTAEKPKDPHHEKMKELYVKILAPQFPTAALSELEAVAEKAIKEEWISPDTKREEYAKVIPELLRKAGDEINNARRRRDEAKAKTEREAQLKALRERRDRALEKTGKLGAESMKREEDIENAILDVLYENPAISRESLKTKVADYLQVTGVEREPLKVKVATVYDKMKQTGKLETKPDNGSNKYADWLKDAQTQGDLDRVMGQLNQDPSIPQSEKHRIAAQVEQLREILPVGRSFKAINARTKAYNESLRGRVAKMPANEVNKLIRDHIKSMCPTVKVRKGRGTAASWLDIEGSGEYGRFTEVERKQLASLGISIGGNSHPMNFDEKTRYIEKHGLLDQKPEAEPVIEIPDKTPAKKPQKPKPQTDMDKREAAIIQQIQAAKPHLTYDAITLLIDRERAKAAGLLNREAAAIIVASNLDVPLKERQHLPTKGIARLNETVLDGKYRVDVWNPQKNKWITEKKFPTRTEADAYIKRVNLNPGWSESFQIKGSKDDKTAPKYVVFAENTKERGSEAVKYQVYEKLPRNKKKNSDYNWYPSGSGKPTPYRLKSQGTREYKQVPDKDKLVADLTQDIGQDGVEIKFTQVPHWAPIVGEVKRIEPSRSSYQAGKWRVYIEGKESGVVGEKWFNSAEEALAYAKKGRGETRSRGLDRKAVWEPIPEPPKLPKELDKEFIGKRDRFLVDEHPQYLDRWNPETKKPEYGWFYENTADNKLYSLDELKTEYQKGDWRRRDRAEAAKGNRTLEREKGARTKPFYKKAKPIVNAIYHPEAARMEARDDNITYQGMDQSHVSMIKFTMPNLLEIPDGKYEVADKSLDKRVTVYRSPKKVEWDNVEYTLTASNKDQRSSIRYEKVHEYEQDLPDPRIRYTAKAEIDLEDLSNDIEDLSTLGATHITFRARDGKLTYETPPDNDNITTGAGDAGKILEAKEENVEATYTLEYVKNHLDLLREAGFNKATLELATDMPLHINSKRGDGPYAAEVWLAPCIGV